MSRVIGITKVLLKNVKEFFTLAQEKSCFKVSVYEENHVLYFSKNKNVLVVAMK